MFYFLIIGFFFNATNNSNTVLNRSFLNESRSITDIKEVRKLDSQGKFTTSDNPHRFLNPVKHWEKVTIKFKQRGIYYLQVGTPSLDEVKAYTFINNQLVSYQIAGDLIPFRQKTTASRNHIIKVNNESNAPIQIYLNIKTTGNTKISISLFESQEYERKERLKLIEIGLGIGLLIIAALISFILALNTQKKSYFLFSSYFIFVMCFIATRSGLSFMYLWPNHPDITNRFIRGNSFLIISSSMIFTYFFLEVARYAKKWSNVLLVICIFYLIATLALLVGVDLSLLPRITSSGLIYYLVLLTTGAIAIRQKQQESTLYTLGIITCSVMAIIQLISLFNNPDIYFATPQFFRLAWYIESIFLALAFVNNYRRLIKNTQITQRLLSETQTEFQSFKAEHDDIARKLVTSTIQNDQYTKTMEDIKTNSDGQLKKQIEKNINLSHSIEEHWQNFKYAFDKVHPDFFKIITKEHGQLTINEQRHLAFIKLNLTVKEIAQLTGVSTQAVKMARNRLKKKLNTNQPLSEFIQLLSQN